MAKFQSKALKYRGKHMHKKHILAHTINNCKKQADKHAYRQTNMHKNTEREREKHTKQLNIQYIYTKTHNNLCTKSQKYTRKHTMPHRSTKLVNVHTQHIYTQSNTYIHTLTLHTSTHRNTHYHTTTHN